MRNSSTEWPIRQDVHTARKVSVKIRYRLNVDSWNGPYGPRIGPLPQSIAQGIGKSMLPHTESGFIQYAVYPGRDASATNPEHNLLKTQEQEDDSDV